jgi:hypothetical protein
MIWAMRSNRPKGDLQVRVDERLENDPLLTFGTGPVNDGRRKKAFFG